jgi:hypothetical protein
MKSNNRKATTHRAFCQSCRQFYTFPAGGSGPAPPCPKCNPKATPLRNDGVVLVEDAISLADEILSLAEDLPSAGEDFGQSVSEKAEAIRENIEAHGRVTPNQFAALENMLDGLRRWFRD